ncbi:MAG: two-component system response regulator, partial [Desulfuromonas sp.]
WLRSMSVTLERSLGINNVILCDDSREVLNILQDKKVCLVLLDMMMPNITGEELLPQIIEQHPEIPVIIISGLNQIETAVQAVKNGAFDYFVKSSEQERMLAGIQRALSFQELKQENVELSSRVLHDVPTYHEAFADTITRDAKMLSIFNYIQAIASSREPVLITGESGTGKELMARAVHRLSSPDQPWVALNVADYDAQGFADALFGHVRGAFQGAVKARDGMLKQAEGGILFLDEVGNLDEASQLKLLRLVQEGEYRPVGSDRPEIFRGRIVCTSNQELEVKVVQGEFRKDLYYRIKAHHVELPPLRDRLDDIALLLDNFLIEAAESMEKKVPSYPHELVVLLKTYHFPGNIRELRSMVYEAVGHHTSRLLSMDVFKKAIGDTREMTAVTSEEGQGQNIKFDLQLPTLAEATQTLVDEALKRSEGNQAIAAKMLGITRQALNQRLKRRQEEKE